MMRRLNAPRLLLAPLLLAAALLAFTVPAPASAGGAGTDRLVLPAPGPATGIEPGLAATPGLAADVGPGATGFSRVDGDPSQTAACGAAAARARALGVERPRVRGLPARARVSIPATSPIPPPFRA